MTRTEHFLAPYKALPVSVLAQLSAMLINSTGGMAKVFMALYLHQRHGVSLALTGPIISLYGLGLLLGGYGGGVLSDRHDTRKLTIAILAASGLFLLLLCLPMPLWLLLPVLFASGLIDGGFKPANQRTILEPCTPAQRPLAQGLMRVTHNLGTALAGLLAGFVAGFGYHWIYLSDGVLALLACLWLIRVSRGLPPARPHLPAAGSPEHAALTGPWQDMPFLRIMLGMVLATLAFDQMYSTLGLYLNRDMGLGPEWLGYVFTLNGLMVVFLQVPIARRIERWGIARCAAAGVLLNGTGYLFLGLPGSLGLFVMTLMLTLGELLISPVFSQLVMTRSEGRLRGRYLGLYSAIWNGRVLLAPAMGSFVYAHAGGQMLWLSCALLVVLAALIQAGPIRIVLHEERQARTSGRLATEAARS